LSASSGRKSFDGILSHSVCAVTHVARLRSAIHNLRSIDQPRILESGMGIEIERKFLVTGDDWRRLGTPIRMAQGYLGDSIERVVRVRTAGTQGFITVKGINTGIARLEYEYSIPVADANEMLERLCLRPLIVKTRWEVRHAGWLWQVDEYHEPRSDLVVAEIELSSVDEIFELPPWIGEEVSGNRAYYNHTMVTSLRTDGER
jgi:adenylate cyclase